MHKYTKLATGLALAGMAATLSLPSNASAQNGDCRYMPRGQMEYGHMQRDHGGQRGWREDGGCGERGWNHGPRNGWNNRGGDDDDRCGQRYGERRGMRGEQMGRHMMGEDRMGQQMGEGRGMRGGQRFMQRFVAIDVNEDGKISDDEAAAMRESVFYAMDADDNGELTVEEYMGVRMGPGAGNDDDDGENRPRRMEGKRQEAKKARFEPMDADKNGTVSQAEWMTAGLERFKAADADGDGTVTPWEFRSNHRR
ncbi:MAG: hypothetical protein KDJ64_08630 [Nitratireductor sp.]|nr:hypothetical protein [Nitratireductor sp.]MCB1423100.1 hypothetical protein [Nitratireductor sp.]